MRDGLKIIVQPDGYYPYVTVGWIRRVQGDEYESVGARVLRRFGSKQALARLAAEGPASDTELLVAAEIPEEVHRLGVSRSIPCNEAKWAEHCPKPKDWIE